MTRVRVRVRGQAYKLAEGVMCENAVADDAFEGMSAFVEKRKPTWKPTH
jgi:1,4-dihydroxy-2-naphthoyl-CoA synthase